MFLKRNFYYCLPWTYQGKDSYSLKCLHSHEDRALLGDMEAHTLPAKTTVEIKTAIVFPPRKYVPGHHYNLILVC